MSRSAKPWYNHERRCWMVWWAGKKVRLLDGKQDVATRKQATQRLADLQYEARHNPPPQAGADTVASVIEAYQETARKRLAKSTVDASFPYLQSFAEAHGWRLVSEVVPQHLEDWLYCHPTWKSDWTKNFAVRVIKAAFNWAVRDAKSIKVNPFAGVTHPPGEARCDMSADQFQAILRATHGKVAWKKITPGARFRQILMFLWRTGARPSEARR